MNDQSVIAVIVGRGDSKGLPGKNALPLANRPVICHTIEDAQLASCVDRIIVSTDGEAIANAARDMSVEVIERPAELATDTASVVDAVRHAIDAGDSTHDIVVILYANAPVRPDDLIDRAVAMLVETGADSVQSYVDVGKYHPQWMVQLGDAGRVIGDRPMPHRRQDLPQKFLPDGGVIAVTRKSLTRPDHGDPHAFFGSDRRGLETPPGAVIDIDHAVDLARAEAVLSTRAPQPAAIP